MNGTYALLLWGILYAAPMLPAGTTAEVLKEVDRLVDQKKYLSAFELLNRQKDGDSNPEIALKKGELALKYFVNSINHRIFSFRDLSETEDILKVRGAVGSSTTQTFDFQQVFAALIKNHPEDGRLPLALADYYLDVYEKYRGHWEKSDKDILESARSHYDRAIALGSADSAVYFRSGKAALYRNDLAGAAQLLEMSVQKSPGYAPARYNLAFAYLFLNRPADAAPQARAAYDIYEEKPLKADAAMLAGQTYLESGNTEEALNCFLLCDRIDSRKYENMRRLTALYARQGRKAEAKAVGDRIFDLDPVNPTGSQAFLAAYMGSPLQAELPGIFRQLATRHAGNAEAAGNALYHLSVYYLQTGENALALKTVDQAEKSFRAVLKEDHAVFKAIGQIRQKASQSPSPKE